MFKNWVTCVIQVESNLSFHLLHPTSLRFEDSKLIKGYVQHIQYLPSLLRSI